MAGDGTGLSSEVGCIVELTSSGLVSDRGFDGCCLAVSVLGEFES